MAVQNKYGIYPGPVEQELVLYVTVRRKWSGGEPNSLVDTVKKAVTDAIGEQGVKVCTKYTRGTSLVIDLQP